MKRLSGLRLVFAFSVLAVIVAGWLALARPWATLGEVPRLGASSVRVAPGVSMLGRLGPSAAYVVETSEGLVLVDSGLERDAAPVRAEMARLGLDPKSIRAILLTHAHGDHCGGAEALRSATGAKIYAGKGDAPPIRAGGPRDAIFSTFHMPEHDPHPTHVDVELAGGETIPFGDSTFRAIAAPGHTPGSICYLMERGGLRVLFAGDVITQLSGDGNPHSSGRRPLGTYSAYLAPRYRGDAESTLASLQALRALPVPDLVLPGHPASDPTPQSPRLTGEQWLAMLDEGIKDMEGLLAHRKADGAHFLDGRPQSLLPDLFYLGEFQGLACYGFFVGPKFFVIDAPGGAGLPAFLDERLKTLGKPPTNPTAVLLTSCNAKDTAGLKALVEKAHAQVVAPRAGLAAIKVACPAGTTILAADDLSGTGWFPVKTLALRGRGVAPTAYLIPIAGKDVLFSGRIPILFDRTSTDALSSDLSASRNDAVEYLLSVDQLAPLKPDLWLPTVPSDDQNAFLYEGEWKYIIANNYRIGRAILDRFH